MTTVPKPTVPNGANGRKYLQQNVGHSVGHQIHRPVHTIHLQVSFGPRNIFEKYKQKNEQKMPLKCIIEFLKIRLIYGSVFCSNLFRNLNVADLCIYVCIPTLKTSGPDHVIDWSAGICQFDVRTWNLLEPPTRMLLEYTYLYSTLEKDFWVWVALFSSNQRFKRILIYALKWAFWATKIQIINRSHLST